MLLRKSLIVLLLMVLSCSCSTINAYHNLPTHNFLTPEVQGLAFYKNNSDLNFKVNVHGAKRVHFATVDTNAREIAENDDIFNAALLNLNWELGLFERIDFGIDLTSTLGAGLMFKYQAYGDTHHDQYSADNPHKVAFYYKGMSLGSREVTSSSNGDDYKVEIGSSGSQFGLLYGYRMNEAYMSYINLALLNTLNSINYVHGSTTQELNTSSTQRSLVIGLAKKEGTKEYQIELGYHLGEVFGEISQRSESYYSGGVSMNY